MPALSNIFSPSQSALSLAPNPNSDEDIMKKLFAATTPSTGMAPSATRSNSSSLGGMTGSAPSSTPISTASTPSTTYSSPSSTTTSSSTSSFGKVTGSSPMSTGGTTDGIDPGVSNMIKQLQDQLNNELRLINQRNTESGAYNSNILNYNTNALDFYKNILSGNAPGGIYGDIVKGYNDAEAQQRMRELLDPVRNKLASLGLGDSGAMNSAIADAAAGTMLESNAQKNAGLQYALSLLSQAPNQFYSAEAPLTARTFSDLAGAYDLAGNLKNDAYSIFANERAYNDQLKAQKEAKAEKLRAESESSKLIRRNNQLDPSNIGDEWRAIYDSLKESMAYGGQLPDVLNDNATKFADQYIVNKYLNGSFPTSTKSTGISTGGSGSQSGNSKDQIPTEVPYSQGFKTKKEYYDNENEIANERIKSNKASKSKYTSNDFTV